MATGGYANLAKKLIKKIVPEATEKAYRAFSNTTSTPMAVDVSAEGMKKKTLARGTGVTYSGVKTSSQGLLTGARTEKKTLLGG
jgi:hypothetical protein